MRLNHEQWEKVRKSEQGQCQYEICLQKEKKEENCHEEGDLCGRNMDLTRKDDWKHEDKKD